MSKGWRPRPGLVDGLVGFAAFCAALATVVGATQDLRLFLLAAAVAYFAAAALRSGSGSFVRRSLLVASGGVVTILLMRVTRAGFTAPLYVPLFLGVAIAAALAGGWFRALWRQRKRVGAGAVAAAAALATALLVTVAAPRLMRSISAQSVDLPAPEFVVTTLAGQTLHARDFRGRVVVVAFWATWCVPCEGELPEVESAYQQFRSDPRVAFLAVDVPDPDTAEEARAFLSKHHLTMPAAIDVGEVGSTGTASRSLGQHELPQIYLLDAEGRVRWVHSGYDASEQLAGHLESAIGDVLAQK